MTKCPWFAHHASPDPAGIPLPKGQVGVCKTCKKKYVVASIKPYRLKRDAPPGS